MNEYYEEIVLKGLDNNIICYDSESNKFSDRLVELMKEYALEYRKEEITNFVKEDDLPGLTKYYLSQGGSLPTGKRKLVLGLTHNDVMLGAY
jgi:hypothetical protein